MVIGVKDVEQGWTNADQDPKEEPKEGGRNVLSDSDDISKGCGSKPRRLKGLSKAMNGERKGASEDKAVDMGSSEGPQTAEGRPEGRPG